MNIDFDPRDLTRNCVCCQSWTRSHRVPNGWCCHSCFTDELPDVLEAIGVGFHTQLGIEDVVDVPPTYGGSFKLKRAPWFGLVEDTYPFEEHPHSLLVEHPQTTIPFELPLDEESFERLDDREYQVENEMHVRQVSQLP